VLIPSHVKLKLDTAYRRLAAIRDSAMSRRSSSLPALQQQQPRATVAGTERRSRVTMASLDDGALLDLRDGDVFYRTVRSYPGLPDVEDQVSLVVNNAAADGKKSTDRRASVNLGINAGRDGSASARIFDDK